MKHRNTGSCASIPHGRKPVCGVSLKGGLDHSPWALCAPKPHANGGKGVDTAIEALGSQSTFATCISAARAGGTISNVGYHGDGDTVPIPRLDWGVGMSDKTIRTALCPGGSERMERLKRLIRAGRVDPLPMTTHRFGFGDVTNAFTMMQSKEDGMIKPLITFTDKGAA